MCNHWCVIGGIIEDSLLKVNHAIVILVKRNNCWCKKSFVVYSKNGFILRILVASLMITFWKQTVLLSFICVMGNGPMNSNPCLEFSLRLNRILSPTLYWWLFRCILLCLLLWLIRNCLRCQMCSQSATCLMFKMTSRPNTSCIGDDFIVMWSFAQTANMFAARIPDHGSLLINRQWCYNY